MPQDPSTQPAATRPEAERAEAVQAAAGQAAAGQPDATRPGPAASPRRGVAVVTGGSAGVGRAVVRRLAERGWDVGVVARGSERLEATVREVRDAGRLAVAAPADMADTRAVERAADEVEAALGPIDLWVNCAFTGAIAFFDDITAEEYERITAVTYFGYVNGTRAALKRMTPRSRGTVIQVGSALAYRGIPLQSAYCGAKHAIRGFTEAVRVELMHRGVDIRICEVHLPAVNTPQFDWVLHRGIDAHPRPVPPIYQPEVAARAVAWVAEHPRRTMWVGLSTALTALGNRVAPSLLDRYLARTNVDAQQSTQHGPPADAVNLWEPVYGAEVAAHGSFDAQAHSHSPELWVSQHRGLVAAALGGAAVLGLRAVGLRAVGLRAVGARR